MATKISTEELRKMYCEELLTDLDIGQRLGVTDVTISLWRKAAGIPTMSHRDRLKLKGHPSLDSLDEKTLRHLYLEECLTFDEIGEKFGVSRIPIVALAKQFGISNIAKWERNKLPEDLSEKEYRTLIGTLLGDASIGYTGKSTARYSVSHTHKQYTYAKRVHENMGVWTSDFGTHIETDDQGKVHASCGFCTKTHPIFQKFREMFYRDDLRDILPPDRLKAPPLDIFRNLHDESLAYWYFDDGTYGGGLPSIVTFFPLLNIDEVVEALQQGTGLPWYKTNCKDALIDLSLRADAANEFFDRIVKYATPDMGYKFPQRLQGQIMGDLLVPEGIGWENQLAHYPVSKWRQLPDEDKARWIREVFGIYRLIGFPFVKLQPDSELQRILVNLTTHTETLEDGHAFIRSNVGMSFCNAFFPHRYQTVVNGKSAWSTFQNDADFMAVIKSQFQARSSDWVRPPNIRGALSVYQGNRTPANFRSTTTKMITDHLCPEGGICWDPCAGFGGRLLGVLASCKNVSYIGTEPSPQTVAGLRSLGNKLVSLTGISPDRIQILEGVAEKDCPAPGTVDLVLTSPPYFNKEQYLGGPQSHKYGDYESWKQKFMVPLIRNAFATLKDGGYFAINIQDVTVSHQRIPLVSCLDSVALQEGFHRYIRWWYPLSYLGPKKPDEPILVYRKLEAFSGEELDWNIEQIHTTITNACGTIENPILDKPKCRSCGIELEGVLRANRLCRPCAKELDARRASLQRELQRQITPPKTTRIFTCVTCNKPWETEGLGGGFKYCPECQEKARISQVTKACEYRYCGQSFLDTSSQNSMKFCCTEHRRREKLFRCGTATSLDYFRTPDPVLNPNAKPKPVMHTCNRCRELFEVKEGEQNIRCQKCRDELRDKTCQKCGESYRDESDKNTRRYCDKCSTTPSVESVSAKVSDRTDNERRLRVSNGQGGRADNFKTMTPFTHSWWGRVGELLFLHLYPDASDSVTEFGNTVAFDAQHRTLGRVQVRTAKEESSTHGLPKWSFTTSGVSEHWDTGFFIAFSKDQTKVSYAWLVPADELPRQAKFMSPASSEYRHKVHEVSPENLDLLNRKFQAILTTAKDTPAKPVELPSDEIRIEYERVILGRIGEAIYHHLYPLADHVAGRNPLETYDFRDPDGTTVNVRVRRPSSDGRWTFFRGKGCTAQVYFFIGMDVAGHTVKSFYRIPASDMPEFGFSIHPGSVSKWEQIKIMDLPKPVSDFVQVADLDQIHMDICNLNADIWKSMTEEDQDKLLKRAFAYHRTLGFPFTTIPSDKRLASEIEEIRRYQPNGKDLPIENAGLGFCSAYMPHRFKSRNVNSDFSAWEAFWDDEVFMKVLKSSASWKNPTLTRPGIRSALGALRRTPTQFRPAVMKALVDTYCSAGGLVFDPCAGWGGRLMGALVSGRTYLGVEPIKETADALYRMGARLCEHLGLDRGVFRILEGMIQATPTEGINADFAMTSPPYWTQEIYSGGDKGDPTLENWTADFLKPLFEKTRKALKPEACFAVNISDVKTSKGVVIPLESLTVKTAQDCGFMLEGTWRMLKASFGNQESGRYEPILIFRRLG